MPFFNVQGDISRNATSYNLLQWGLTTGARATCGPPQRFQWPAEAFKKNLHIWNMLKIVWSYICLT